MHLKSDHKKMRALFVHHFSINNRVMLELVYIISSAREVKHSQCPLKIKSCTMDDFRLP